MSNEEWHGEERRKSRQSAFDRLLHTLWGVLTILGGVAVLSASVALGAQRYIGAPAANAKAITDILNEGVTLTRRVGEVEDDVSLLGGRVRRMEAQHVDINRSIQRLGIIICASLGNPDTREVRVACAALTEGN